ncbi:MAG: hypothetical protein QW164_00030 [Desulfurococcaceae archaeon]
MNSDKILCEEKKHFGGKMVKVCVKAKENNVRGVIITGDFFVDPEEKFDELTNKITNLEVSLDNALTSIMNIIRNGNIKFYGISLEDIEYVVKLILVLLKQ